MDDPLHALRRTARGLLRTRGFTTTALLTLGLGLGLTTAVFTVTDALLLRRLPVRDQDRLVLMWGRTANGSFDHYPLGWAHANEFTHGARSLDRAAYIAYEGAWPVPVRDATGMSSIRRALVSGDFFSVLGATPALGRALGPQDDVVGAAAVAVISHRAWLARYAGDASAIGRRIVEHASGRSYTIVGVMPPGLDLPRGVEMWAPIVPARTDTTTRAVGTDVDIVARLASGATPDGTRAELAAYFTRPGAASFERELRGVARTLPMQVVGDVRPAVLTFAGVAGLMLLITCINVSSLLLVRGLARMREIAVRVALGAERRQVMAQLLGENSLLALAGGALGIAVAWAAVRTFIAFAPSDLPRVDEIRVNGVALAAALAITTTAMSLFGVVPAILASRGDALRVLRGGGRSGASRRSRLATEALVAGQVALAVMVLAAAGLIARSLVRLQHAELSFEPTHLVVGELALRGDRFATLASQVALLDRLQLTLGALPTVKKVSPLVALPFAGSGGWDGKPEGEGQSVRDAASNPILDMQVVGPDFFATLGLPVSRGRSFAASDREGAPPVVILSATVAERFWPGQDPIGKRVTMTSGKGPWLTVVGVVPETRYRELRTARPSIYFPLHQSIFPFAPLDFAMRASGDPLSLIASVRRTVAESEPGAEVARIAPFASYLEAPLAQPRLNALMLGVFAMAAVLLAAVGLFGVMATMVRRRTREMGVRMAVGASSRRVWRLVMRRGLAIAGIGTAAGLLLAMAANRLLATLLYEVSPTDMVTLGGASAAILLVAVAATLAPARTSARIEPAIALRVEE